MKGLTTGLPVLFVHVRLKSERAAAPDDVQQRVTMPLLVSYL